MALLSIIIPFGLSEERTYIEKRVIQKAKEFKRGEKVDYIFVEGYSSTSSKECQKAIEANGHFYIKDENQKEFSLAKCRNLGARHTKTPCMLALDADCILTPKNLEKIIENIEIKQIHQNPAAFLVLPCVFLNETASENFTQNTLNELEILQDLIYKKREYIEFFGKISSSIVLNTFTFLELGGYDEYFTGHGYEDFEFLLRLLRHCADFEYMPKDLLYHAKNWDGEAFKGFRSWFSMLGLEASFSGIYLYHLHHIRPNQNNYLNNTAQNQNFFLKRLSKPIQLDPLVLANAKEKLCIPYDESSYLFRVLTRICVFLGEYMGVSEGVFFDAEEFNEQRFLNFIKENKITKFLMFNPYGRERLKTIYEYLRTKNFAFLIFERGAFPNAWFFDESGFLAQSLNYDEALWNKPLSKEEKERTKAYIDELLSGNSFLEDKNKTFDENELKISLALRYKRVVFVPLQVESDTAVRFFTQAPFTYWGFLQILDELAELYAKEQVVFVCKKHPLSIELNKKAYKNLIFANDECSIVSLLKISCACVCLNSGSGLYAMILQVPTILCADAFYSFENLNLRARSKEGLKASLDSILQGKFRFDEEKCLAFIKYLKEDFYSFAETKSIVLKNSTENVNFRRTTEWNFYQIIIEKNKFLNAKCFKKQEYKLNSLHYLPFIYEIKHKSGFKKMAFNEANFKAFEILVPFLEKFRIFRLFRKLFTNPKAFFADSKNPLFYPLKKICLNKLKCA